jgi:GDPmannose 4,6-dehydratase
MKKKALIFGISGQGGFYLSNFLKSKNYEIVGVSRNKKEAPEDISSLIKREPLVLEADVKNYNETFRIITEYKPNEIYNLCGPSSVSNSFLYPDQTYHDVYLSNFNILESIKQGKVDTKYFNSCSGECFGETPSEGANEFTPFKPKSPYGLSKAAAYDQVKQYREKYGVYACSGILFNHESPRRSRQFVLSKIIHGAFSIFQDKQDHLELGNINIYRDWGWAPDYVEAMWLMMQLDTPHDFVVSTGTSTSLKTITKLVFSKFDLEWEKYVRFSQLYERKSEIIYSNGNPEKIYSHLGWKAKYTISEIIDTFVSEVIKKS